MAVETISIQQLMSAFEQRLVPSPDARVGFLAGLVIAEASSEMAARILAYIEQRANDQEALAEVREVIHLLADHLD